MNVRKKLAIKKRYGIQYFYMKLQQKNLNICFYYILNFIFLKLNEMSNERVNYSYTKFKTERLTMHIENLNNRDFGIVIYREKHLVQLFSKINGFLKKDC